MTSGSMLGAPAVPGAAMKFIETDLPGVLLLRPPRLSDDRGFFSETFRESWLAEAGLEETWFRSTQAFLAVTRCYPGRAKSGSGDRVPTPTEQSLCRPYLDEEIALLNPGLVMPVGRLAIGLYYPGSTPLERIIGTEKLVEGRWIIPLPHPSGASRWHQSEANHALIRQAIELIARRAQEALTNRPTPP